MMSTSVSAARASAAADQSNQVESSASTSSSTLLSTSTPLMGYWPRVSARISSVVRGTVPRPRR